MMRGMADLFASAPAGEHVRPTMPGRWPIGCARRGLDEVVGPGASDRARKVRSGGWWPQGRLASMILWGPPGTGKTTIARLLAQAVGLRFEAISAVFSGVADLKRVFAAARDHARTGTRTLLFVDEIHRFNRAQQDGFPPLCGGRHRHPGGCHYREPLLRAQRRACSAGRRC